MAVSPAEVRMRSILIFGLLRSGTTILTDLLTSRGKSVVFSEPMLMHGWRRQTAVIPATLSVLGMAPLSLPDDKSRISPADWFDAEVLPLLQEMHYWGMKEVHFDQAEALIRRYPPDYLLLSIRDPRDLFFSALDLTNKLLLAFEGGKFLRDEAWVYLRLRIDVQVLAWLMSKYPCTLLRYEDQSEGNDWPSQVSTLIGEHFELDERVALAASDRGRKIDEHEKHGSGLSFSSLFRWVKESTQRSKAINYWLWKDLETVYSPFGYTCEASLAEPNTQAIHSVARPFHPAMEKMLESPRFLLKNEGQFLFALRAGRRYLADALPKNARVVEFDPYLPALKYLGEAIDYSAVTRAKAQRLISTVDWQNQYSPSMQEATHFVFNHVLEFDADWSSVLNTAMDARKIILMTVFLADDIPSWWGEVNRPEVSLSLLFAVAKNKPYDLHVSGTKAYGARLIILRPTSLSIAGSVMKHNK